MRAEIRKNYRIRVDLQIRFEEFSKTGEVVLASLLRPFQGKRESASGLAVLFAEREEQPGRLREWQEGPNSRRPANWLRDSLEPANT